MDEKPKKADKEKRRCKLTPKKKKREEGTEVDVDKIGQCPYKADTEKKRGKLTSKKKRKREKGTEVDVNRIDQHGYRDEDGLNELRSAGISGNDSAEKLSQSNMLIRADNSVESDEARKEADDTTLDSSKKGRKGKKKDHLVSDKVKKLMEKKAEAEENEVYRISSGDEDCSKGMKKWITEYHRSRPGLKMLQQRVDDFITTHEAQEEQEKKEREARVAEGGWTVVKHHKGRKKTTDSESGLTVGSVAQAAVMDKMAKKKKKGVALDFYNFQKREAQRNEVMLLQSKFEEDKKRIQQMRAARKFRPY